MMAWLMGLKTISPESLRERMQRERLMVVDVNSAQSWNTAHIPGSVHLDEASFVEGDLPKEKDSGIVFYCSNPMCRKAPNAARRAKGFGYANVQVMSAGISGWISAKLPTEGAG
jgi:rhodanese-related sulfurtransferase